MTEPNLFTYQPPPSVAFDGATYDPNQDHKRLRSQLDRVYQLMKDGAWHTLAEIHEASGGRETAASARIRDLRKEQYGGHDIKAERVVGGLYRYRLVPRDAENNRRST